MAQSLFSDVYEPSWMVQRKSPIDYLLAGQEVGNQIARTMLAAREVEMRGAETTAQIGNIFANTELKKKQLEEVNAENKAWLQNDVNTVPKWMMTPIGKLDEVATPEPKSQRGMDIVQKRLATEESYKLRKAQQDGLSAWREAQVDLGQQRIEQSIQRQKDDIETGNAWAKTTQATRAQIEQLPNQGKDPKTGFWTEQAKVLIDADLTAQKLPRIGEKPPTGKAAAAAEPPEFFTDTVTGKRFMRWGNKHYDMGAVTAAERARISVAVADVNRADAAMSKAVPGSPEEGKALSDKLKAQEQLDTLLGRIEAPKAKAKEETKATATAKTVRVRAPDGTTGTIPADQLEAAKQQGYNLIE